MDFYTTMAAIRARIATGQTINNSPEELTALMEAGAFQDMAEAFLKHCHGMDTQSAIMATDWARYDCHLCQHECVWANGWWTCPCQYCGA